MNSDIEIIEYTPELKQDFYTINHQWISTMFKMEAADERALLEPEKEILEPGGFIWFARHHKLGVVGTCALIKKGENNFELTKMGVLESARGLKIGEQLLKFVIDFVRKNGFECFLLTNSDCEAAIHLYEKNGFSHDREIMEIYGASYNRCNVAMRLY